MTHVSAPIPIAMWAAWVPTTPPPMTTTLAGSTPGTPPSSIPLPPLTFSSAWAAAWMESRPATSDIGASRGRPPAGEVTVS